MVPIDHDALKHGPISVEPEGWPQPKGYSNGMVGRGTLLVTGGLVGWDAQGQFPDDFIAQVAQTLRNVVAVLEAGGAKPEHIVRMTWYVTDMDAYRNNLRAIGAAYRETIGRHFPAMALVQVVSLVEPKARIEIETTAVIPD
ncbi:MAG: RidA family protein [Beijerinckiaceae bacterium]|nr:RidA family protein [Beijerinckiaceae bacterium]